MPDPSPPHRSTFVTVLAWTLIVLAGFSTLMSAAQNVMFAVVGFGELGAPSAAEMEQMPPVFRFMLANMRAVMLAFLLASVATLACAIGLLRRRNWARRALIALLALGIAWNLFGLVVQQLMFGTMHAPAPGMAPELQADFHRMATTIRIATALVALAFAALFGWIIRRLVSQPVREEFGAVPRATQG